MPMEAEEDWITAVTSRPMSRDTAGLEAAEMKWRKASLVFSGSMAELMACIPLISTEKASNMSPTFFCPCFRQKKYKMMPTKAMKANTVAEEKPPSPSTPARVSTQPVAVVPMLAPMTMPTALLSCMMPELTKPTTITVVAEEDWITAVTSAPSSTPLTGLEVSLPRMVSSLLPATFLRPSPSRVMPNRKKASPPSREIMSAIPMYMFLPAGSPQWLRGNPSFHTYEQGYCIIPLEGFLSFFSFSLCCQNLPQFRPPFWQKRKSRADINPPGSQINP